jgi:pimeloyl-ACP methyl ester carboxylesterase
MIWILLILTTAIGGAFLIARTQRIQIADARKGATGGFYQLRDGVTHANWHGPIDGPIAVCIHGLSTSSYVWGPLLPHLTAQGYRVLTYDLFGRGLSDRPHGPQTREFFLRQLRDLLAANKIEVPVTLIGYSMGGCIASARAVEAPDQVSRLILLAPAGLGLTWDRFTKFIQTWPILGDWVGEVLGPRVYRILWARAPSDVPEVQAIFKQLRGELGREGYLQAIISSLRNMLIEDMDEDHILIAKSGFPVLAIWGGSDPIIPLKAIGRLSEMNRNAIQVQLAGAGHGLPYTHTEAVADAIEKNL